jgi:hypothetical protein
LRAGILPVLLGAVALAIASSAEAGISLTNPGFETGGLSGWSGSGFVTTNYEGYTAPDGSDFAVVLAGCPTNTLAQSFSASAGDTVSGWSFFKANDYLPFNDSGGVRLAISGGGSSSTVFSSSVSQVGSYGGTPWERWSYTVPSTGTYQIVVYSSNYGDCGVSSAVGIDLPSAPADTTPPTITSSSAYTPGTWTNQDVTVHFDCTDGGSGVATVTPDQTLSTEGADQSVTGTCTDEAGNSASATFDGIDIDKTAPTISFSGNTGSYDVDQTVAITCSATDTLSGVADTSCPDVVNMPAWQLGLGSHGYDANATDNAGNSGTASTAFVVTVDYDSLCALTSSFSTSTDVTQGLCDKLAAAKAAAARGQAKTKSNILGAFDKQVDAQSGKALTAQQAALLKSLAASL